MARPLRLLYPRACYHVTARGSARKPIGDVRSEVLLHAGLRQHLAALLDVRGDQDGVNLVERKDAARIPFTPWRC